MFRSLACACRLGIAFLIVFLLFAPGGARADTVLVVRWQEATGAAGYRLVAENAERGFWQEIDMGEATQPAPGLRQWIVSDLPESDLRIEVAAYDHAGRTGPGSEPWTVAASAAAWLRDSDGDGLADALEDLDSDGRVDPGESDPRRADSDGDGTSDGEEFRSGRARLVPDAARRVPVCGDGRIDGAEQCDLDADFACVDACLADCTCPAAVALPAGRSELRFDGDSGAGDPARRSSGSTTEDPRLVFRWQAQPGAFVEARARTASGRMRRIRYVAGQGITRVSSSRALVFVATAEGHPVTIDRDPFVDLRRFYGAHAWHLDGVSVSGAAAVESLFVVSGQAALAQPDTRQITWQAPERSSRRTRFPAKGRTAVATSGAVLEGIDDDLRSAEFELRSREGRRFRIVYRAGAAVDVRGRRAQLPLVRQPDAAASELAWFPLADDMNALFGEDAGFSLVRVRIDGQVGRLRLLPAPLI